MTEYAKVICTREDGTDYPVRGTLPLDHAQLWAKRLARILPASANPRAVPVDAPVWVRKTGA